MRDPYEILGVSRDATFEQIRSAYRRASKKAHPDLGGSHEQMVELNTAYSFLLNNLRRKNAGGADAQSSSNAGSQSSQGTNRKSSHGSSQQSSQSSRSQSSQEKSYKSSAEQQYEQAARRKAEAEERDIDEELDELRRASERYDTQFRAKRDQAWKQGEHVTWAKMGWDDFFNFLSRTAHSGIKGVALLVAALMGVGSFLVEINIVSAVLVAASLAGFALSVVLKSDKGGMMSGLMVLLGLASIWLPPLRLTLLSHPFVTISLLACLGLIFKFSRAGRAGLLTGGLLTAFLALSIVSNVNRAPSTEPLPPADYPPQSEPIPPKQVAKGNNKIVDNPPPAVTPPAVAPQPTTTPKPSPKPQPPAQALEERTLIASDGAKLSLVGGVAYHFNVQAGQRVSLSAIDGSFKVDPVTGSPCQSQYELSAPPTKKLSMWQSPSIFMACDDGAQLFARQER